MPIALPQFLPVEQEARLISLLRGASDAGDAGELQELAARSGVAGVVAHILGDSRTLAIQEMNHRRGIHWLRRAGQALDAAGVPFLALKGLALSERYYQPHYLRACGDLDLLIEPRDYVRADAAVRGAGYMPSREYPSLTTRILGHDATYDHATAPTLELHLRLHSHFGIRPAAAPFFAGAVRQTLSDGYTVRVLGPVDEFVHLAAHAAAHRWSEARWVHDLYLLLRQRGDLDWEAVARRTESLRLWPSVLLTCVVLESEWGTPVPLAALAPDRYRAARALLPSFRRSGWAGSNASKTRLLFHEMALCGGPVEKARHLARGFAYPVLRRLREMAVHA